MHILVNAELKILYQEFLVNLREYVFNTLKTKTLDIALFRMHSQRCEPQMVFKGTSML